MFKREDEQRVFSFKLRGAYNKIAGLDRASLGHGVIAASAGNYAQGVALAAAQLGLRALIVMPRTTPEIKVESVRELGAEGLRAHFAPIDSIPRRLRENCARSARSYSVNAKSLFPCVGREAQGIVISITFQRTSARWCLTRLQTRET